MYKKITLTLLGALFSFITFAQSFGINEDSLFLIRKGKKYGYINQQGKIVVAPQYRFATSFSNGRALIFHNDGYVYMDKNLTPVIPTKQYVKPFSDGLRPQQLEDAWGYCDTNFQLVLPFQYQEAGAFYQRRAWVKVNEMYAFINPEGQYISNSKYAKARDFHEGLAAVMIATMPVSPAPIAETKPKIKGKHTKEFIIRERIIHDTVERDSIVPVRIFKPNLDLSTENQTVYDTISEQRHLPVKYVTFKILRDTLPENEEKTPTPTPIQLEDVWKWGFVDIAGKLVIPAVYNAVGDFKMGLAYAIKDGKYGYIDKSGNWKIEPTFDSADDFQANGIAKIFKNNRIFFIDTAGNALASLPENTARVAPFRNGFAKIMVNDRFGFINQAGKVVVPATYEIAFDFEPFGVAVVGNGGEYGLIDTLGNYVLPLSYDDIDEFRYGFAKIRKGRLTGFINQQGKMVIPLSFDNATAFNAKHFAMISKGIKVYKIDTLGNFISRLVNWKNLANEDWQLVEEKEKDLKKLPTEVWYEEAFSSVTGFSEGFAVVPINGKAGFIDNRGAVIIPPVFEEAQAFSEGLAPVRIGDKWGYVNYEGKRVIQPSYLYAMKFKNGIAKVFLTLDKAIYIDKQGNEVPASKVKPILKDGIDDFWKTGKLISGREVFRDKSSKKYGYKDEQGRLAIQPAFDNACDFSNGLALVLLDGIWMYINKLGVVVWEETD